MFTDFFESTVLSLTGFLWKIFPERQDSWKIRSSLTTHQYLISSTHKTRFQLLLGTMTWWIRSYINWFLFFKHSERLKMLDLSSSNLYTMIEFCLPKQHQFWIKTFWVRNIDPHHNQIIKSRLMFIIRLNIPHLPQARVH